MISQEQYNQLIHPWQIIKDENTKRNYFFNPETNESRWDLPEEVSDRVHEYYQERIEDGFEETNNVAKYIPAKERMSKDNTEVLKRPAVKQVEVSLAKNFAYKQGDEEYNIWYDKWISENRDKEREKALTRCIPEVHAGYTKADRMEKFSTYFCIHFARGCCAEGSNCKYYHRIPTMEECQQIDQIRDIFGRARFAEHREDNEGVGCFMKDIRTLNVTEFRMPGGNDPLGQMYEILWRHFSPWGEIEDIDLNPGKGIASIKYAHRCMAELARVAMMNQSLDNDELLILKWGVESEETEEKPKEEPKDKKKKNKKKNWRRDREAKPLIEEKFESGYGDSKEGSKLDTTEEKIIKQRKKEVEKAVNLMDQVLKNISEQNEEESAFDENGNLRIDIGKENMTNATYGAANNYVNPLTNNMPLFMK